MNLPTPAELRRLSGVSSVHLRRRKTAIVKQLRQVAEDDMTGAHQTTLDVPRRQVAAVTAWLETAGYAVEDLGTTPNLSVSWHA